MSDLSLLDHIISQTRQNIELLSSHNRISKSDAHNILARLPITSPGPGSIISLTQQTQQLKMSPPQSAARSSADSHTSPKKEARAIWEWTSEDPNDLSFHVGEIIEIVSETNVDWWMGRNKAGKEGLFPSTYVERLPLRSASPSPFPKPRPSLDSGYGLPAPKYSSPPGPPHYSSPPSVQQQYYPPPHGPPPVTQGSYMPPPGPIYNDSSYPGNPPVVQPTPQQPPKKGRFGNLGATMAQSAAGGLGFGAGAAIGSDVVNSIF